MKKVLISVIIAIAILIQTGCFGSFELTRKVYQFNEGLDNKFVQEVVFIGMCIIPVYELAGLFDVLLFNTIEFWTGSNPVGMNEGEMKEDIMVTPQTAYKVTTTKNNIHIQDINDNSIQMNISYDPEMRLWSVTQNQQRTDIMRVLNSHEVEILLPGNIAKRIDLSDPNYKNEIRLLADK